MAKTVFFGPFIGEFGWELLWWQGWVKKLCRTEYASAHKVAASFPGRQAFYPDVDEFWGHPEWFQQVPLSQRAYFADFWRNGAPRGNVWRKRLQYGMRPVWESVTLDRQADGPDAEAQASKLLAEYQARLPAGTEWIVPFQLNTCPASGVKVGLEVKPDASRDQDFVAHRPRRQDQRFEQLEATAAGEKFAAERIPAGKRVIAVFPRSRAVRRPDKNWPQAKYDQLLKGLQERYPDALIALLGEPRGAYYADGVPDGCVDVINVDPALRMDAQVAVLNRASLAIGGMSGAMLFAAFCGCPVLIYGFQQERYDYHHENALNTRMVYYPFMDAAVEDVLDLAAGMIEREIPPPGRDQTTWDPGERFGVAGRLSRRVRLLMKV